MKDVPDKNPREDLPIDDSKDQNLSEDYPFTSEEEEVSEEDSSKVDKSEPVFKRGDGPKINFDYHSPGDHDEESVNEEIEQNSKTHQEEELDNLPEEQEETTNEEMTRRDVNRKPISETIGEDDDFDLHHVRSNGSKPYDNAEEAPRYNLRNNERNRLFPYETNAPKKGFNKIYLFLLLIVGLGVLGGTFYLLKNSPQNNSNEIATNNATPAPSATATPVPTPLINRADITVQILNGTNTSGLAASASAKLKSLGYKTAKEKNATNSAFERTVVRVKKDSPAGLVDQLIKDLLPTYDAVPSTDLKSTESVDAEVILGVR